MPRRPSASRAAGYNHNVFVNCPFDEEYLPLLRPLLFTIIDLGLTPRIALDKPESGRPRIERIVELIRQSRFAVHDLSRIKAKQAGELFRLNMPFELGLDVGCRRFDRQRRGKLCLILEAKRYRYQAAISDLAGSDIATHGGQPAKIVAVTRDWLNAHIGKSAPGPAKMWARFNEFMACNDDALRKRGYSSKDIKVLKAGELMLTMREWVRINPNSA